MMKAGGKLGAAILQHVHSTLKSWSCVSDFIQQGSPVRSVVQKTGRNCYLR